MTTINIEIKGSVINEHDMLHIINRMCELLVLDGREQKKDDLQGVSVEPSIDDH